MLEISCYDGTEHPTLKDAKTLNDHIKDFLVHTSIYASPSKKEIQLTVEHKSTQLIQAFRITRRSMSEIIQAFQLFGDEIISLLKEHQIQFQINPSMFQKLLLDINKTTDFESQRTFLLSDYT